MNVGNLFAEFLANRKTQESPEWRRGAKDFAVYLMKYSDDDNTLPCPVCEKLLHVTAKGRMIVHGGIQRCDGSGAPVR